MAKFVDVEGSLRTWARNHPLLTPLLAGRVFFGVPAASPVLPLVTVARIGGGPQPGEAPLEDVRITFEVWAKGKEDATEVMTNLVEALFDMRNDTLPGDTHGYSAQDVNVLWQPDNTAKLARYIVDCAVTVRSST